MNINKDTAKEYSLYLQNMKLHLVKKKISTESTIITSSLILFEIKMVW